MVGEETLPMRKTLSLPSRSTAGRRISEDADSELPMGATTSLPARSNNTTRRSTLIWQRFLSMSRHNDNEDDISDDLSDSDDSDPEQHKVTDAVFRAAKRASRADFFISHVWSAPRWQKALALNYYVNVCRATALAILTWLCIAIGLIGHFGVDQMGGKAFLLPCLVYIPMAVFAVIFFFGHKLPIEGRKIWLDKMCIHQSRGKLKEVGVTALPEFVANSERLCILWCDVYFERLWCNLEVATFCAINEGADKVDLQPLWLAPWVIATLVCDLLSISIADRLFELIPIFGDYFARQLPDYPTVAVFLMQLFGIGTAFWISYMPATIPNWISFSTKMHNHACMLGQTKEYRLKEAKCTVESDRPLVEQQIKQLFQAVPNLGEASNSTQRQEALTRFDNFMQQDFKHQIAERVGVDDSLNYPLALLVLLPMLFDSIANVLGCDGMPCDVSSISEGYNSVRQYMITNSLCWTVGCLFIYPTTYPVMLGLIKMVTKYFTGWRRNVVGVLCSMSAYFYMAYCEGSVSGLVLNAVVSSYWQWKAALTVVLGMLLAWNRWLFRLPVVPLVVFYGCFMGSILCLSTFG